MVPSLLKLVDIKRDTFYVSDLVTIILTIKLANPIPSNGGYLSVFIPED